METKFKIGDVIKYLSTYTVLAIIFEHTTFKGNWFGGYKEVELSNSYVLMNHKDNFLVHSGIKDTEKYILISSGPLLQNKVVGFANVCPRCTSPLVEKMSIGLGEMIKKCSNPDCGWC